MALNAHDEVIELPELVAGDVLVHGNKQFVVPEAGTSMVLHYRMPSGPDESYTISNEGEVITLTRQRFLIEEVLAEDRPPVLCEWLPWNHTFGGNATFNMVLRNGGTMYIDGGKPVPGLIEITAKNLKEVSPTMYLSVPRGFDLLLPHLESDAQLRKNFFRDLDLVFYAGAALPPNLWERIEKLAIAEKGGALAMVSAWGSTETAPKTTCVHFHIDRAGVVGLPTPGAEVKLVPDKVKEHADTPSLLPKVNVTELKARTAGKRSKE